ncbi:carbohydrate sulfotransferase 13 [Penaeus vannamei]|uniref:carbohydrate sulfotransferase 13 n=1 Tax=Penaeus vannamei TaxID=6689 RepID=UPI00387F9F03
MESLGWRCNCCHSPFARSLLLRIRKKSFLLLVCGGFLLIRLWLSVPSGFRKRYLEDWLNEGDEGFGEESHDVTQRLLDRKENLLRKCSEIEDKLEDGRAESPFNSMARAALLYNVEHKLMVCVVGKAGASTWRRHMLALLGIDEGHRPRAVKNTDLIDAKRVIGLRDMKDVLENPHTTWIMNTRHPLERLVSSYRGKFVDGKGGKEDRLNEYVKWAKVERDKAYVNGSVTFLEFLEAVILDNERNGRAGMVSYLQPSATTCSPCALPYDYIIRTDTFAEDLACIATNLQLEGIDPELNHKSDGSRSATFGDYYEGIPHEMLREIFFLYEEDFFLFGFDLPPFLLEALREW